ncbi:hypothetical protein RhiirC2_756653 [Rhizophagus irregularis]|uniref:Uncharacterized protein n=1 Tax=Rhizophagus irregularis TaxID=588596 RepID=A0A2N1MS39_9GLOM|nr:hypothetical protein RhiirC2_756653 [Rhizophagus irregularis]
MGDYDNPRTIQSTTKIEGIMYRVVQLLGRKPVLQHQIIFGRYRLKISWPRQMKYNEVVLWLNQIKLSLNLSKEYFALFYQI